MGARVNIDTNMYDYSGWEDGQTGSVGDFIYMTTYSNNIRDLQNDPFGNENVVWRSICDTSSGGLYYAGIYCNAKTIDPSKLYRVSFWENRRTNGSATSARYYFGLNGYGTTDGVTNHTTPGAANTNPYFWSSGTLPGATDLSVGNWVLIVGHIWPYDQSVGTTHADSGRWMQDGTKLGDITNDWSFLPSSTSVRPRTLSIYQANNIGVIHDTIYPRMDVVDGTEPSLETLLNNEGMWREVSAVKINIGDAWKTVPKAYINIGDSWKEWWSKSYFVDASGGTVTTDGDYKIHTFTSSGTFVVTTGGDVSCLIVGGGSGSGGPNTTYGWSGGGGGGQVKEQNITVSATSYDVSIGAGGSGGNSGYYGQQGGTSSIGSVISAIGGIGASTSSSQAADASINDGKNSGNGYIGGLGWHVSGEQATGGGGAGAGANGSSVSSRWWGGVGGAGKLSQITGNYYGGGGGGANYLAKKTTAGGIGGGGTGGGPTVGYDATDGAANTGGGGGGRYRTGDYKGKSGGSGIVVIKYKYQ